MSVESRVVVLPQAALWRLPSGLVRGRAVVQQFAEQQAALQVPGVLEGVAAEVGWATVRRKTTTHPVPMVVCLSAVLGAAGMPDRRP